MIEPHELRFQVRIAKRQLVHFRPQLFEPDEESFTRHMALLQKNAQQHRFVR